MSVRTGFIAIALALIVSAGLAVALRAPEPAPRNTCPICLQTVTFVAAGEPPRPSAGCPYCASLERHRLLYLYFRQKTALFRDQLSVLHFSPEKGLGGVLAAQRNLNYKTAWYEPERAADYHLDLTNLALPDNSWDVLITYHILEHIPDDRQAMREMFRVLKPGGWAAVQSPVREQPDTFEDPSIVSPKDREAKYGNADHVRYYGYQDFSDRLTQAGFQVTIERFGHELSDSAVREFGLDRDERIYIARKPAVRSAR